MFYRDNNIARDKTTTNLENYSMIITNQVLKRSPESLQRCLIQIEISGKNKLRNEEQEMNKSVYVL